MGKKFHTFCKTAYTLNRPSFETVNGIDSTLKTYGIYRGMYFANYLSSKN